MAPVKYLQPVAKCYNASATMLCITSKAREGDRQTDRDREVERQREGGRGRESVRKKYKCHSIFPVKSWRERERE